MTAFETAWALLKMPFVSADEIPEVAWAGVLGSVHPYERAKRDFWVDNIEDPDAWGMHRNRDYRTGDGTHIGAEIPFFEIHPSIRGKGRGREALIQYIRELKQLPEGENMRPSSKVMATAVIPSSRGFGKECMKMVLYKTTMRDDNERF